MKFLTLDSRNFNKKKVLVRIDINSPIKNKKIQDVSRIKEHARTIAELSNKGAGVVVLAHQGRPGEPDFTSLRTHARILYRFVKKKVRFVSDVYGKKAIDKIKKLKKGQILLLENVRFLSEEVNPKKDFKNTQLVRNLSPLFDYFVMDAFSVAHRNAPSMQGFAKVLPTIAGRVMEKELTSLKKLDKIKKPYVFILGGAKPDDLILLFENKKVDYFLIGGVLSEIFYITRGVDIGIKKKFLSEHGYLKSLGLLEPYIDDPRIILPVDFALEKTGRRTEMSVVYMPYKYPIYDIGEKTQEIFIDILKRAKTVYIKGPLGMYEKKGFGKGSKVVFSAVAKSKAFSILGGGHTLSFIDKNIGTKKFSYVSLAGGALLEYLAGKKLPGVEILRKK